MREVFSRLCRPAPTAAESEALRRFAAAVRSAFGSRLERLTRFGSGVRGEGDDESDLDLLVLLRDATRADQLRVHDAAHDIFAATGGDVSPLVRTPEALSRACFAAFHAARALRFLEGLEPRSHRGARHLLDLHLVRTGGLDPSVDRVFAYMEKDREDATFRPRRASAPRGRANGSRRRARSSRRREDASRPLEVDPSAVLGYPLHSRIEESPCAARS